MAKHVFTEAETASGVKASKAGRKAERRLRKELATLGLTDNTIGAVRDIAVELIRTANSNPLTGILVAIASVELLYKLHIISKVGYIALYAIIGSEVVVNQEGEIISAIAQVDKLFGNNSQATPINPSATTIVYPSSNSGEKNTDLQALMKLSGRASAK